MYKYSNQVEQKSFKDKAKRVLLVYLFVILLPWVMYGVVETCIYFYHDLIRPLYKIGLYWSMIPCDKFSLEGLDTQNNEYPDWLLKANIYLFLSAFINYVLSTKDSTDTYTGCFHLGVWILMIPIIFYYVTDILLYKFIAEPWVQYKLDGEISPMIIGQMYALAFMILLEAYTTHKKILK